MLTQDAVDLVRGALFQALVIAGPVLIISMLLGLLLGAIQTAMHIQDAVVSIVPRLLLIGFALLLLLPWMADRLVEYSKDRILQIPSVVAGKGQP